MIYPYQHHSETSRQAAENLTVAGKMESKILAVLGTTEIGWTGDELQRRLEQVWPEIQAGTISARLRGLEMKGHIVKGAGTRPTRTGRSANEWWLKKTADRLSIELAPSAPPPAYSEINDLKIRLIEANTIIEQLKRELGR